MTVDALLDAAREIDPDGYSREALRSMYNGSRRFKIRAMAAMIEAVGGRPDQFPEYELAAAQYLLDDGVHGIDGALANLADLGLAGKVSPSAAEIRRAPIRGRAESVEDGSRKARRVRRRRAG